MSEITRSEVKTAQALLKEIDRGSPLAPMYGTNEKYLILRGYVLGIANKDEVKS